jgi:uncharacterized protein (TIGR02217 family)
MEFRAAMMTYPRYRIVLGFEVLRSGAGYSELQDLIGFFNLRKGAWDDFLWLDPDDNTATESLFGTGDGSTKVFQLSRDFGGFREPVQDFVGVPVVSVDGVEQSAPAQYSISAGRCTFVGTPADGAPLRWSGQFRKRVRFARDEAEFERFLHDLWVLKKIELITVKK